MRRHNFHFYFLGEETEVQSTNNFPRVTKPSYGTQTKFKPKVSDLKQDLESFDSFFPANVYQVPVSVLDFGNRKVIKMAWGVFMWCFPWHPMKVRRNREEEKRNEEKRVCLRYSPGTLLLKEQICIKFPREPVVGPNILLPPKVLASSDGVDCQWVDKESQAVSPV